MGGAGGCLGIVAWAVLTGHLPFGLGETLPALTVRTWVQPEDPRIWNRLVDLHLRRYGTVGRLTFLQEAARALRGSLAAEPDLERNLGGLVMRARVALACHRCRAARIDAERLTVRLPEQAVSFRLLGDALYQRGDLEGAERAWWKMQALGEPRAACEWRGAQLDLARGQTGTALERLAAAAASAATDLAATPEGVAWYRVQWGEAAFRAGDWPMAERQYTTALAAAPGSYAAREHLAELRGAQGRTPEARASYLALIRETARPELLQALGDLCAYGGNVQEASSWYEQAERGYLTAVRAGNEAWYSHHLAGFYADARLDPAQAVAWAERDLQERQNGAAHDALAWALCKAGRLEEAVRESDCALATGSRDAHLLYHAGLIHMGCHDLAGGSARLRQAAEANPRFNAFHVHR